MSSSKHVVRNTGNINLIFCLDWFALIGENSLKEINKIAKNYKASHICLDQNNSASGGLAFIDKKAYYSAAQLFAQSHVNETIAIVLQLDVNQWWLVAAQKGSVITLSDKIFDSKDQAQQHILGLQTSYTDLEVVYVNNVDEFLNKIASNKNSAALIQATNHKVRRTLGFALMLFVLLCVVWWSVSFLNGFKSNNKANLTNIDIEQSWDFALKAATNSHNLHDAKALIGILQNIYSIPVAIQGWLLNDAQCSFVHDYWHCSANYYRNHILANNKSLVAAIPSDWQISFTPLDQARVSWKINNNIVNVLNADLKTTKHNEVFLFSELQKIKLALPKISIQAPKAIEITAPTDDKGLALPKPAGLPNFFVRDFQIKAPLRSLSLLLLHTQGIAWKKIALVMQSNLKPSLTASAINVTLDGVLYEKD